MQSNTWVIAGLLVAIACPATAQSVLHCDDLQADQPGDAARAFACLERTQDDLDLARSEIETLKDRLDDLARLSARVDALAASVEAAVTTAVPAVGNRSGTRAVVAYTSDQGERTCPAGWEEFVPAQDRFILGAGGAYPVVGTLGGEAEVTLSEAQMPPHIHNHAYVSITKDIGWANAGTNTNLPYFNVPSSGSARRVNVKRHSTGVFPAGGGKPHPNMPPYIALYFCQSSE